MKNKLSFLSTLLCGLCLLFACNTSTSEQQGKTSETSEQTTKAEVIKNVSSKDFAQLLAAEPTAILLDVRTPEEYAQGHLKNATLMNIQDGNFEQNIAKLDKSKPILVYCAAGGRSSDAAQTLQTAGFTQVYNLAQGFNDWAATGMEVEK